MTKTLRKFCVDFARFCRGFTPDLSDTIITVFNMEALLISGLRTKCRQYKKAMTLLSGVKSRIQKEKRSEKS